MSLLQTGACFTAELNLAPNKAALAATFKTCAGTAHAAGDAIPTCAEMTTAIAAATAGGGTPTGAAGGALAGTYPNPTLANGVVASAITALAVGSAAVAGVTQVIGADGQKHTLPAATTSLPASSITAGALPAGVTLPATGITGVIPAANLPSYVDDVLEFPTYAGFPAVGETGKIYVDAATDSIYRWSGTTYIAIVTGGTPTGTAGGALSGSYPNPALTPAGAATALAALTPAQIATFTIPVYANDGVTVLFRAFPA